MKKGLLIAIVVALVLALAVPAAFALTDSQKAELESLYQQREQLMKQIFEKQVEAGIIDAEDAELIRERMEERMERHQERMAEGDYSFGFGKKVKRGGMMGRGFGGRGVGCGNCPVTETGSTL